MGLNGLVGVPKDFFAKLERLCKEGMAGAPGSITELGKLLFPTPHQIHKWKDMPPRSIKAGAHARICTLFETSPEQLALPYRDFLVARTRRLLTYKASGWNRRAMANGLLAAYRGTAPAEPELPEDFPLLARAAWIEPGLRDIGTVALRKEARVRPVAPFAVPVFQGEPHHAWLGAVGSGVPLDNRPAYRLLGLERAGDGGPLLRCADANYFNMLDTCGALEVEFAAQHYRNPAVPAALELCGKRRDATGQLKDPFDLRWRNAVPGINTLLVVNHMPGGESRFFVHDRTGKVAEAAGTLHVVPAGTFQPDGLTEHPSGRDFSLERTIWREFAEELLGQKSVEELVLHGKDFLAEAPVRDLHALWTRPKPALRIFYLGCGLDPLTLKPELLCMMVVDAREIPVSTPAGPHLGIRDVDDLKHVFGANWEGKHDSCALSEKELLRFVRGDRTLAAGAAAMQLAARHVDAIQDMFDDG
jgi:hypothetical protein